MKTVPHMSHLETRRTMAGIASIEFAVLLPMLLLLAVPTYDLARNIQANMILVNVSREGANLALRASLTYPMETIMNDLASTTPPLDMANRGMIYITEVMGNSENCNAQGTNCTIRNIVLAQYEWQPNGQQGAYTPSSAVWNCSSGNWGSDGNCGGIGAGLAAPTANALTGQLAAGQIVYVVESFYKMQYLFGAANFGFGASTTVLNPNLYSMNVF
ncbi:TadE-like protein [Paraburkholderia sp. BL23I1N1]|uniref:TadE/TadG family type IV pilus assembly protein n=1 Tax=Paraburkholderia sp. BL23I1N1 TaxID=1938802 RepID=UPI000E739E2C|nr:TadE/TadG family type IV pilus assembly protein [Paraburkholderia sp. BL23I1N1]RKE25928.1 TadE-like protein [Paraburkholderia sp. BL23I1N1]